MKQCSWCSREGPEWAKVCEHCGHQAADALDLMVADEDVTEQEWPSLEVSSEEDALPPPSAGAPTGPRGGGAGRGAWIAIVLALIGPATVTFALLVARGLPAPDAAAASNLGAPATEIPSAAVPEFAPAGVSKWSSANRARWTGNQRRSVAFELPAENKVPVWLQTVHPILVVRCLSNETDVFVFTGTAAKIEPQDDDHTVRIGFDDDAELTERWPDSVDHDALFAPDGAALARRLIRARTMRFGFTPHNASPVVVRFDVSGLGELITRASRECGWN